MNSFMIEAGRKRRATVTVEEQPGAHTGASRKYIPGYSDSNIVFLNTSTGNDGNTGASIAQAVLTYAQAATLAGSTKKIRVVNDGAAFTANVTKPIEMTVGVSGTISSSLTAPLETFGDSASTTASKNVYSVAWAAKFGKFIASGLSGGSSSYFAYSSNGTTWSDSASTTASRGYYSIAYSDYLGIAVAVGYGSGVSRTAYTVDGITWTDNAGSLFGTLYGVAWDNSLLMFVAVGEFGDSLISYYSSDGQTWISGVQFTGKQLARCVCKDDSLSLYVAAGRDTTNTGSAFFYSSDGVAWSLSSSTTANRILYAIAQFNGLIVAVGEMSTGASYFAYSSNGTTWADSATTDANTSMRGVAYVHELGKFVACGTTSGGATVYYYSADGITWTLSAATTASRQTYAIAYSPLLGLLSAVGNTGAGASYFAYSTAYATTISAAVAGFSIQAVQYSGTVTAYNCTLRQPGTTAALSTENCRFTESGAHISNNAQKHQGLLVEGDVHFTTTPAAQNAFSFTRYTVAGRAYIHNASATYFEEIKDGIVTDGIAADYQVVVESGNVRGTCTNVVFGLGISVADPAFADTTDYQLKREVNGYDEDSVCVAKASYYYNSVGTRRDVGAWSHNETSETYIYERAYEMRKPSAKDATSHLERLQTSLYWGEDQTPDVATDPEARGEELTLSYRTLPVADINFIRYLRTLKDPTVRIDYDPQWQPATTVTVDGNQSAGEDVLLLLTSTLEAGQKLTIAGKSYYVMRMNGTTKAVLNQPLADGVTNGDVLTVSDAIGKGVYQVVPQSEMNLTRFYENNTAYFKGAVLKFVRKSP